VAQRTVDKEGDVTEPVVIPKKDGEPIAPFFIEIPLWRFGRIKFENYSGKASLALFALVLLVVLMAVLALVELFPGEQPGTAFIMEKTGEALLLILGVLLGAVGDKPRDDG
jgi:hypothetical protein